ncbi:hypothetical protein BDN72DRAFT_39509 [Pluteus cervinus]|uniref:Uncharacterized protein n=1 Tax=Pluteus cervinus TaxID=181527 RepID=A0ACD3BHT8_9AGAR|nr:hypothetical protein BDN72DRAFT_39509 [Pluteus cervinus]
MAESVAAVEAFQNEAKEKTDAAVAEGQRDIEDAKVSGVGYLEKTKQMASDATARVQAFLPLSVGSQNGDAESTTKMPTDKEAQGTSTDAGGVLSSVQGAATSVVEAGKQYLDSAQRTAQPHIDNLKGMVQGAAGTAGVQDGTPTSTASPTMPGALPGITAPLESGPHTVTTMYPPDSEKSGSVKATDIAKTERR